MRNAILAITFALTLVTGSVDAQRKRRPRPDVGPDASRGLTSPRPTWRSPEFYGKLFDWTFTALQGTDLAVEDRLEWHGDRHATPCGGQDRSVQWSGLCPGNRHPASCNKAKDLGGKLCPGFPSTCPTAVDPSAW